MITVPIAQAMTAEEFLTEPVAERGRPWNLVDGEVVVNDPSALHGHLQGNLFFALESWTRAEPGRGHAVFPRDVALDELNVFAPDLLWYADGRLPPPSSPPPYPMPDLAVEVRSPSTWRYDIGAKKSRYEAHGLPELWLVDSLADTLLVFRRSAPGCGAFDVALELGCSDELASPLLPGFALPLDKLFRVP
ncbi:MAG: Uma2 family endonuclease [Thermoleophilaceae bacterium]